jgi:hypothetical protein
MVNSLKPGGFTHTDSPQWDSSWPRLLDDEEQRDVWAFLEERFGISPEARRGYTLWDRGKVYWGLSAPTYPIENLSSLKVVSVGIPLVRRVGHRLKPTTSCLRLFSNHIVKNRIHLKAPEVIKALLNAEIPWPEDVSDGYVLIEAEQGVLGCGLMCRGKLQSQIPKSESAAFRSAFRQTR